MDNTKMFEMMLEAAENKATLNAIKGIASSEWLSDYSVYARMAAVCAALGIPKDAVKND